MATSWSEERPLAVCVAPAQHTGATIDPPSGGWGISAQYWSGRRPSSSYLYLSDLVLPDYTKSYFYAEYDIIILFICVRQYLQLF